MNIQNQLVSTVTKQFRNVAIGIAEQQASAFGHRHWGGDPEWRRNPDLNVAEFAHLGL